MAKGPLVPQARVRRWEAQLATALEAALGQQRRSVWRRLGAQPGMATALTAAAKGKKHRPAVGVVAAIVWTEKDWRAAVDAEVAPVIKAVAADALRTAKAALPAERTMGMPVSSTTIAAKMTDQAYSSGDAIGVRVNAAASGAGDLAEAADDADDVMDAAGAILDNTVGTLASAAANLSTSDVTSYLSGFFGNLYEGATKTWNTMGDDRVRYDHAEADGQEVALNDVFVVGGETMVGPHDPSASDAQTMGCRCFLSTDGVLPEGTTSDLGDSDTELAGGMDALIDDALESADA